MTKQVDSYLYRAFITLWCVLKYLIIVITEICFSPTSVSTIPLPLIPKTDMYCIICSQQIRKTY